jgi:hypothetical protein
MAISSLFTFPERLFAKYLVEHPFNDEIHAEYRCPGVNQDYVRTAYFTLEDDKEIQELDINQLREKRVARFDKGLVLPKAPVLSTAEVQADVDSHQLKQVKNEKKVYYIVHGPLVDKVEKTAHRVSVKYGNLVGQSHFQITKKSTGYHLIEGWLVVSIPAKIEEKEPFEFNDEIEITVVHQFNEDIDPVSSKISGYVQSWFNLQSEKLWIAFTASVVGSALFSLTVIALGHPDHFAGRLFSRTLVIGAVSMLAMVLYSGVKLYKLLLFKEKMLFIDNLGDWVQQVRLSICNYPELCINASHLDRFFTPKNQQAIRAIRERATAGRDKINHRG